MVTAAAEKADQAFNTAELQTVETAIKQNYVILQSALGAGMLPPPDKVKDEDIAAISQEVIGTDQPLTARAQAIRDLLKASKPDDYDMLMNAPKIHGAAVTAVDNNTSSLVDGWPSLMNLFSGLFKWISSGFEGGFDGLKNDIAQVTVENTEKDFQTQLAANGVDLNSNAAKLAISKFNDNAEVMAGTKQAPQEPAFDLANVVMAGAPAAAAANTPPSTPVDPGTPSTPDGGTTPTAATPEERHAQIAAHFQNIADTLNKQFGAMVPPENAAMFRMAREEFVAAGTSLTENAIKDGKPAPSNYEIIHQAFLNAQTKLGAGKNTFVDNVVTAFANNKDENLQTVMNTLRNSPDANTKTGAPIIMAQLDQQLSASQQQLAALMKGEAAPSRTADNKGKNQPSTPGGPGAQPSEADLVRAAKQNHDMIINGIKQGVAGSIPKITVAEAKAQIDASITKTINKEHSWIGGMLNADMLKGYFSIPSDEDRTKLANLMVNVPDMAKEAIFRNIDLNPNGLSPDSVVRSTIARFDTAFDKGLANGTIPAVWKDHKAEIEAGLAQQLHAKMDKDITRLAGVLKTVPSATMVASTTPAGHENDLAYNHTPVVRPANQPQLGG